MEDFNTKVPYLKRMDRAIFEQIDKFKTTPNYTALTDFYNGLEEEQQKVLKFGVLLATIVLPVCLISFLMWQNGNIRDDLDIRTQIMNKAQQIIGESRGVSAISPDIISTNPIDSEGMLTSRISNAVAGAGVDTNKITRGEFSTNNISEKIFQTDAVLNFNNMSSDELMNVFSGIIRAEKMRITEVTINRNADTGLLGGNFRIIHLATIQPENEGE